MGRKRKQQKQKPLTEEQLWVRDMTKTRISATPPGYKFVPKVSSHTNQFGKPCMPPTEGSKTQQRKKNKADKGHGNYGCQRRHEGRSVAGSNRGRAGHSKRQMLRTTGSPFNKLEGTAEDYVN